MPRTTTLADLRGENAYVIMGTIAGLLKQIDRAIGDGSNLVEEYHKEAMSGDYANLCAVSERYALRYAATTLQASEGDLTGEDDGPIPGIDTCLDCEELHEDCEC